MDAAHENPRIFISVAEQSADEHAAALVAAFRRMVPGAVFEGLAGPALTRAGCDCFHDMTARSAMATAALGRIPEAWKLLKRLKARLAAAPFDAAVVVDSPALNLPVARICRRAGIPVLYYIAPQTWAWGPKRIRNWRLRQRVTRLACIWPFEEDYFRRAGIAAEYVGHPSFDRLTTVQPSEDQVRRLRGAAKPVITILPGSRRHVIEEVLPGQLDVATALCIRHPRAAMIVVAANPDAQSWIEAELHRRRRIKATIVMGDEARASAILAADLCLVASGTVTLEVAYRATPMIVMYNTNRWTYQFVGRWMIRTAHLSIPNILAGRRIVPEFMPYYRSVDPIIATAMEWLATPGKLERIRDDLRAVVAPIAQPGAAENAARILHEMLSPSPDVT